MFHRTSQTIKSSSKNSKKMFPVCVLMAYKYPCFFFFLQLWTYLTSWVSQNLLCQKKKKGFLKIEKLGSFRNKVTNPSAPACQLGKRLFSKRKRLNYVGKKAKHLADCWVGVDKGKLTVVANSRAAVSFISPFGRPFVSLLSDKGLMF